MRSEASARRRIPDAEIRHLVANLASVRHVQFFYLATETMGGAPPLLHAETPRIEAPQWFVDLFPAERPVETYPVMIHGVERGEIIIVGNPLDEIGEVWAELVFLVGLLAGASVLILAALLWTARLVARPMQALSGGLDRLGRGEFAPIGRSRVSELQNIGEKFNSLAQSLDQARSDNRLLIDKLIMVQESERREIARELHDDFGATLFSIRTELALIRDTRDPAEIGQHTAAMSGMIDDIQKQNYRMLDRLRPGSLAHARLSESIGDLVDAWAERHRGVTCSSLSRRKSTAPARRRRSPSIAWCKRDWSTPCAMPVRRPSRSRSPSRVAISWSPSATTVAACPPVSTWASACWA